MNSISKSFIFSGIYSLIGIFIASKLIHGYKYSEEGINLLPINFFEFLLIVFAFLIFLISILTTYILARKNNTKISKNQILHFFIPLILGSIILFILLNKGYYRLVPSVLLISYGIALLNVNRLVKVNLLFLALSEIIIGIVTYYTENRELLLLAIGFGFFPILYGIYFSKKSSSRIESS
ncbi:MAG: hypothetical protein KAH72_07085 [Flavobacteriaceae bacterium]|nr:hypothetical protein [Flavobacteriaceae bacterium]